MRRVFACALGSLLAMAFVPPAAAQESGCAEPFEPVRNVPRPEGSGVLEGSFLDADITPSQRNAADVNFGRSRAPRRLQVEFESTRPFPPDLRVNEIAVAVELSQEDARFVNDALSVSSTARGSRLLVNVCIDPAKARRMPPGRYTGSVVVDDARLPSSAASFTVALQYENWVLLLLGHLGLIAVAGTVLVWLGVLHARGQPLRPRLLRTDLPAFVWSNVYAVLLGLGAAILIWKTQYLDNPAWAGALGDQFTLFVAMGPAFVGGLAGGVVRQPTAAPAPAPATVPAPAPATAPAPTVLEAPPPPAPMTAGTPSPRRRRRWPRVLVVASSVGAVAVFGTALLSSGPSTEPGGVTGPSLPTTGDGEIPDVFEEDAEVAAAALEDAGFVVFAYSVCSSSVAEGRVRQVVALDGTVLVDRDGPTDAAADVEPGASVEVKVSTGEPCP